MSFLGDEFVDLFGPFFYVLLIFEIFFSGYQPDMGYLVEVICRFDSFYLFLISSAPNFQVSAQI